jgi:hypothetical protein
MGSMMVRSPNASIHHRRDGSSLTQMWGLATSQGRLALELSFGIAGAAFFYQLGSPSGMEEGRSS